MARYIDAEAFERTLVDKGFFPAIVARALEEMPTADVAPKSEVAREIILEIDLLICCHANGDINDRRLYSCFDDLKKKYVGGWL